MAVNPEALGQLLEQARLIDVNTDRMERNPIAESLGILEHYTELPITKDDYWIGTVPRLSPYDLEHLPDGVQLVQINPNQLFEQQQQRSYDIKRWNSPEAVLQRIKTGKSEFKAPIIGRSTVLDEAIDRQTVYSFDDLQLLSPIPERERNSRKENDRDIAISLMGRARLPLALGSMPDVGSALAYITAAQSGVMAFISRDKVLADPKLQAQLVELVMQTLDNFPMDQFEQPNDDQLRTFWSLMGRNDPFNVTSALQLYHHDLRRSWKDNIGAAIEASDKGIQRAFMLYEAGCTIFRPYSPEGGLEIPWTVRKFRAVSEFNDAKIVAGQIMNLDTAKQAEDEGADALIIGVAGGRRCTTSKMTDIAVNTPGLLYLLRGRVGIPIGIEGGGVGSHLMTAYVLGASFLCKPGEIGISIEGAGGKYMLRDKEGNNWMLYGGEASDAAKWWAKNTDELGRPLYIEGETGVVKLGKDQLSMTNNIRRLREQIATGLVFQRAFNIPELHQRDASNVAYVSPAAANLSGAYGT